MEDYPALMSAQGAVVAADYEESAGKTKQELLAKSAADPVPSALPSPAAALAEGSSNAAASEPVAALAVDVAPLGASDRGSGVALP